MADTAYSNGQPIEPHKAAELHTFRSSIGGSPYMGAYLEITSTGGRAQRVHLDRWQVRRLAAMAAAIEAEFDAADARWYPLSTVGKPYAYPTVDALAPIAAARVKAGLTGRKTGPLRQPYDAPAWPAPRDPWVGTPGHAVDGDGNPVPGSADPYHDPASPFYRPPDYRPPLAIDRFLPSADEIAADTARIVARYGHAPMTRDLPPGNTYRAALEKHGAWPPAY